MSVRSVFIHLFHPQRSNNHRPRVLHPHAYPFLALIALGFYGLLHSSLFSLNRFGYVLGFASSITPAQVVEQTNAERAKVGLLPLVMNSQLSGAALAKGQDMFNDQYWAHVAPDGKEPWSFITEAGYSYKVAGENLAKDFGNSSDMMAAWMNSPTHRANIVNSRYQEIGIAVIDGVLSGQETTLVVQMFGTPQAGVVAVPKKAAPSVETSDNISLTQPAASPVAVTPPVVATPTPSNLALSRFIQPAPAPSLSAGPTVLASTLVPMGNLTLPPLFSALQLTKAFFLAMIMMIVVTLAYDAFVIGNYRTARLVGKNLAHIIFLLGVSFLLIFFKGGIVG